MNQQLKSTLQFLLFFGLGAGLLYFAIHNLELDYHKILDGFNNAHWNWLVAALCFSLVSHWLRAARWSLMLEPLGVKPSTLNSFYAVMIGYVFNFAIPRMGEISRCGVLNQTNQIPVSQSLGTVVVERIFDLLVLILLTLLVLVLEFNTVFGFFNETVFEPLTQKFAGIGVVVLFAGIAGMAVLVGIALRYKHLLIHSAIAGKVITLVWGFADGFRSVFKLRKPLLFFVQTIGIWVLYFCNTYAFLQAFDATAHLSLSATASILVIGTFGFAAPVSGGIGAYHLFVAKGLALYGVASVAGGVFGFVSHGLQMLMILVVGGISFIAVGLLKR